MRFGLTEQGYADLLAAQGGVCAICKRPETAKLRGETKALAIDHDHRCCPARESCGKCVRGLLCSKCNVILALANDRIETLASAIRYLSLSEALAELAPASVAAGLNAREADRTIRSAYR